jgi:hypothetical protein
MTLFVGTKRLLVFTAVTVQDLDEQQRLGTEQRTHFRRGLLINQRTDLQFVLIQNVLKTLPVDDGG